MDRAHEASVAQRGFCCVADCLAFLVLRQIVIGWPETQDPPASALSAGIIDMHHHIQLMYTFSSCWSVLGVTLSEMDPPV